MPETVATLGHVRGRGPLDTSSAKQDEVDSGRDGAGKAGGSRPAPIDLQPQKTFSRMDKKTSLAEAREAKYV